MREFINIVVESAQTWGANASPEELERYAAGFHLGMGAAEHEDACKAATEYDWHFEPAYPLAKIDHNHRMNPDAWARWMHQEIEDAETDGDGREQDYQRIFDEPLREPIIIVEANGSTHVTDGCHRVGAYAAMGRETIPAVVGTPKMVSESAPAVETVSDELLRVLRAWGDNTVFDRSKKEHALFDLEDQAAQFRRRHSLLYRGQGVSEADLETLKAGHPIHVEMHGSLSSWTADQDTAYTFAEFGESEFNIVIAKRGLETFFDFGMLGAALHREGRLPDSEEHDLHDPIREEEVVVLNPAEMVIHPAEVQAWFNFGERGNL